MAALHIEIQSCQTGETGTIPSANMVLEASGTIGESETVAVEKAA